MTDTELIAAQARRIAALEEERRNCKEAVEQARLHMICIGGPLNDNVLGYSPEQLTTFRRIDTLIRHLYTGDKDD